MAKDETQTTPAPLNGQAVEKKNAVQSRYVCEGCSGIAYYINAGEDLKHPQEKCTNCGIELSEFKRENLIPLTGNEAEQLRAAK